MNRILALVQFSTLLLFLAHATDEHEVYFVPGAYSGLTNQLLTFYGAALFASDHNWTLVLPNWKFGYNQFVNGQSRPFSFLYSLNDTALSQSSTWKNFRYVNALPPERMDQCLVQLQCSSFPACTRPSTKTMMNIAVEQKTLCINADTSFYLLNREGEHASIQLAELRNALDINSVFLEQQANILSAIYLKYNTTRYISLHYRIEADFQHACKMWKRKGWENITTLSCYEKDKSIYQTLLHNKVEKGSTIIVMNGEISKDLKEALPNVCNSGIFHCERKETLSQNLLKSPSISSLKHKDNALAMIDYVIAIGADKFVGNIYSTMSLEIITRFKSSGRGKDVIIYNKPCTDYSASSCP